MDAIAPHLLTIINCSLSFGRVPDPFLGGMCSAASERGPTLEPAGIHNVRLIFQVVIHFKSIRDCGFDSTSRGTKGQSFFGEIQERFSKSYTVWKELFFL